jgi:succinoglycan biosynthesis protein ExoU
VVRPDSLSGQHRTEDLRRLWDADRALAADASLPPQARRLFGRHANHIRARYELRRFLDVKANAGLGAALVDAWRRPTSLPQIAAGILSDKIEAFGARQRSRQPGSAAGSAGGPRYLLQARLGSSG